MRRSIFAMTVGVLAPLVAGGCKSLQNARYIYQDGEYGVIGIPENSPFGSKNYKKQAEELMAQHFPGGYEVVRAEEVVEGQRVLDKSRTEALETDPTIDALNQKIQVGKLSQSSSTQQKDSLPILESRIIYKKRTPEGPPGANGYAATAALVPEFYLDPNEMARCRERIDLADLKKAKEVKETAVADKVPAADKAPADKVVSVEKTVDPQVRQASHDSPK